MGRLCTFLLLLSSSPSEEFESSSALDGMVSKSSVSIEGKRRWVHPWGTKKSSNESLRKKNLYTFGNRRVQKVLLHKIRSLENQTHQFRSFSLWWLPGWEVDLGTVALVLVVPLFLLSAGRASRKESERKVPFWLMSASDTMGWHSTTHKHANIYKWSTANPITSFNKQTAAICTLGK